MISPLIFCVLLSLAIVSPFALNYLFLSVQKKSRENPIYEQRDEWGEELIQTLIEGEIRLRMTPDMVRLAWGEPSNIDQKKTTEKYQQERWVYGTPRKGSGANYITFRNGEVTKTEVNTPPKIGGGSIFSPGTFITALVLATAVSCYAILYS